MALKIAQTVEELTRLITDSNATDERILLETLKCTYSISKLPIFIQHWQCLIVKLLRRCLCWQNIVPHGNSPAKSDMKMKQCFTEICCICLISKALEKMRGLEKYCIQQCDRIRLLISNCLELGVLSFPTVGSWTSYVSIPMLMVRGYSLKYTQSIPTLSIFIQHW